ncbi:MAG: hypothetical protein ACJ0DH_10965 [bacterium]
MDLFYTAEWMAKQEQDHSLPMHKKLNLQPFEEEGTVFKMYDGDTEKAQIDLHDRNPGEVFKARILSNGNTFKIIDDSEDSSKIQLWGNGTVLEANCRGWLGHRICLKHERKEYQLLQNPLTRSFTLLEENRKELGSIRAEYFFSDNYRVELPEDLPFSLILFLSCRALCDSERPMMPVYSS